MIGFNTGLRENPVAITLLLDVKRLSLILLLLILPLQAVWAAAGAYCQHEQSAAAKHLGHHPHQHQVMADGNDGSGKPSAGAHADCSTCHLSCPAAAIVPQSFPIIAPALMVAAAPPGSLPSSFLDRPERPKWDLVS